MPKNTLADLRNVLFAQLENLANPEDASVEAMRVEIEKAKQIAYIGKLILQTGMAELKHETIRSRPNAKSLPFFGGDKGRDAEPTRIEPTRVKLPETAKNYEEDWEIEDVPKTEPVEIEISANREYNHDFDRT